MHTPTISYRGSNHNAANYMPAQLLVGTHANYYR